MELIKKSLDLVNKNLIMIVPFLLQMLLVGGMTFIVVFFGSVWFFSMNGEGDYLGLIGNYRPIMVIALSLMVFALLIQAFVMSGTVGMGKVALNEGKPNMSDFFHYGKKHFIKVLYIELLGGIASILVMAPIFLFLIHNIENIAVTEMLPLDFFLIYFVCGFVAAIIYFIAHFSIVPLIQDEEGLWAAIGSSFRILPKGFKDCMMLLFVSLLVMIMFFLVSLVLAFIPIVGQLIIAVVQFYFVVVLLMWSLSFYEKYNKREKEEIHLNEEKGPIL